MASSKRLPKKSAKRTAKPPPRRRPSAPAAPKALTAGQWFEKLVALQARLRAPNGCPWDREQTHSTLRTYLLEEAYEVLDALESGDGAKFAEEMGDLLLQIVFHSQIATEERRFTVADVIREIHEKMVRRHPHVFGEKRAKDAAEVLKNWERIKAQERKSAARPSASPQQPPSILDGVLRSLPATLEAFQLTRKASRVGFDWDDASGVVEKLREETAELTRAIAAQEAAHTEEEMGDLLFAAVNLSRKLGIDPEIALRRANQKFSRRFRTMEQLAAASGQSFADAQRAAKEVLWEQVKASDRQRASHAAAGAKKPE